MPKRLELRQLEVEGRRELLRRRGGGAERLGDGQAQLDLTQGLLPAVQACLPVRERGEVRLRRGKGAGVRLLLSGKRRPERAEGRVRAGGGGVGAVDGGGALLEAPAAIERDIEQHLPHALQGRCRGVAQGGRSILLAAATGRSMPSQS